jgi:hypothetical protein
MSAQFVFTVTVEAEPDELATIGDASAMLEDAAWVALSECSFRPESVWVTGKLA